jgi:SAM-dependent methyltransferase
MSLQSEFLDIRCTTDFLDKFVVRKGIVQALRRELPLLHGTVLDVGCGRMPYRGIILAPPSRATKYIGLDLDRADYSVQPDLIWDGAHIPLPVAVVECALATEVFEHSPEPERLMAEIHRVLRPEGLFFFTTPFFWPLHEVPHDEYRYTPFSLQRHLRNAGFERIQISALGGWDASLAQMMGLWLRRRPMRPWKRRLLSSLALPVFRALVRSDRILEAHIDQTMVTSYSGTAIKPDA